MFIRYICVLTCVCLFKITEHISGCSVFSLFLLFQVYIKYLQDEIKYNKGMIENISKG